MIRIGTLGAARITPRALMYPAVDEPRVHVAAVAARDRQRAEDFARQFNIGRVHDDYADVIADDSLDAIYIPLPITAHRQWTLAALAAGKHVLCEKSFASNAAEAQEMADAARSSKLTVMDAFHYRYHPMFHRAVAICRSGELGDIQRIEARFHAPVASRTEDIRMHYETAGGVTMDIGCYPVSWVRHLAGEEPEVTSAEAITGPPDVDLYLTADMKFQGGAVATIYGDMRADAGFTATATVTGDKGTMTLQNPLVPQVGHALTVTAGGHNRTEQFDRRSTYGYQLDAFCDAVAGGPRPLTDADEAVNQMKAIDACYLAAGLRLRGEN